MSADELIGQGRTAYARMAWQDALDALTAADGAAPLASADLERLAMAGYLLGRSEAAADVLARAYQEALRDGEEVRAARAAFWLGFALMSSGEMARGGGWLSRAEHLLAGRPETVEHGYLLLPAAMGSLDGGEWSTAADTFREIGAFGERYGDADLATFARLGQGQASIGAGDTAAGMALLDEAMVAVTAGEVSPLVSGIVYCAVVEACHRSFDVRRAREWTQALDRWVDAQPDLVLFRGQCLLYRARLLVLNGAWRAAADEGRRALDWLVGPPPEPEVGEALYQQGELHRLGGRTTDAEAAYRAANRAGRQPEPGLALLRLAQGRTEAAAASLRRELDETSDRLARPAALAAYVDVMLVAGDIAAARIAAGELSAIATDIGAPLLGALADRTDGAVLLAGGDAQGALGALRRAWSAWHDLDAPYEAARTRLLIGRSCRALGDEDTARMEFEAAADAFRALGARPSMAEADAFTQKAGTAPGGLTRREIEVLRLVATGKTNRAIATELVISDKTVARHVSNILTKLDLPSRAAATAFAYDHGLV
ncbi:MAG TPA: helix-turn-helix transcriptional regulator [Candidatus Limnocylindrales bacterium]|jgi:DNA-binding CsgD family transcriptional regulator